MSRTHVSHNHDCSVWSWSPTRTYVETSIYEYQVSVDNYLKWTFLYSGTSFHSEVMKIVYNTIHRGRAHLTANTLFKQVNQ